MLKHLELDEAAYGALMQRCVQRGILFLSTPFNEESCDLLAALGVLAFNLPSGELTNLLPLLRHAARKGKPIIISTGVASLCEVNESVSVIRQEGKGYLALLHCGGGYPTARSDINLRTMVTLREAFGIPTGYSDHTLDLEIPLAAVALGACIVEKRFTLDQSLSGPDHKASLDPRELAALVAGIRKVEITLGDGAKLPSASEADTARVARKSLVAVRDIPGGAVIEPDMIGARRPGTGMAPGRAVELLGRRAAGDIAEGTLLTLEMFE